ncbi:hypothetical protein ACTMUQ_43245 [Streptomyces sp. SD11]|uniref:hypothetical protein n=1 Tax=Streptomyces sp. SD11 TaxID=3452209 RepID=UPI003F8C2CFF
MPETAALNEPDGGGIAAPVDEFDLGDAVLPALDDAVLGSGSLADVVGTASLLSGISDSFQPMAGLGTILSEFTALKNFGLAPAIVNIELPIPVLPNIGETVGRLLLDGLWTHGHTVGAGRRTAPGLLAVRRRRLGTAVLRRGHAGDAGRTCPGQVGLVDGRTADQQPGGRAGIRRPPVVDG